MSKSSDATDRPSITPFKQTYRVEHDWNARGSLSDTIVRAVAEIRGVNPRDLPPLYDTLDGEALDLLFRRDKDGGRVTDLSVVFEYADARLEVRNDGTIEIHSLDSATTTTNR